MDRHGKAHNTSFLAVDVMASVNSQELPAVMFENFGEIFA